MRLYAQPYNLDAKGFYFESMEEYAEKAKNCVDSFGGKVEEFEIQFIDGTDEEADLAKAIKLDQANLEDFFNLEDLDEYDAAKLFYLVDNRRYTLAEALPLVDDVILFEGTLEQAAEDLFDECYLSQVPESIRPYIDYKKFARDCEMGSDMDEFEFAGVTYTCTNVNGR